MSAPLRLLQWLRRLFNKKPIYTQTYRTEQWSLDMPKTPENTQVTSVEVIVKTAKHDKLPRITHYPSDRVH